MIYADLKQGTLSRHGIGWFEDPVFRYDIIVVLGTKTTEEVQRVWNMWIGKGDPISARGPWDALHIQLHNRGILGGSAIFLSKKDRQNIIHECFHAQQCHMDNSGVTCEETRAVYHQYLVRETCKLLKIKL